MAKANRVLERGFGKTSRKDAWWLQPAAIFLGLSSFIVYATWAAMQGEHYAAGPYLSPFYSPLLWGQGEHAWFGARPEWFPAWISPALLILPFPAGFRLTCYYYRGAYYKSFWADPPACAVSELRKGYTGENGWPLIAQNIHRYFLYAAILFLGVLWYDAIKGYFFEDGIGIGVGSLALTLSVGLLTMYTFSCHSLRHLVGGRLDKFEGKPVQAACFTCVSRLNGNHMGWAWMSLFAVMFADLYVRLVSMGVWTDWRIL